MFQSTRIKLTLWYLLISMAVSLFFSLVIYFGINQEFNRIEEMEKRRAQEQRSGMMPAFQLFIKERETKGLFVPKDIKFLRRIDPEMIQESRMRIIITLAGINAIIFSISGLAGYFLAGRTLRPIKEMMDEQNRFITDASHELRTPLTSLKSTIEVYLRDKKLTLPQAREVLESNLEEVNNLQILSDHLMQLMQDPQRNKMILHTLALDEVIKEAIKKITPLARQKNMDIRTDIHTTDILGERQSLVELFVILLDNAIKYSPEKKPITISTKIPDGKVIVRIADEGIGIAQKDLPQIFDRFYRADSSRNKTDVSGYGLGLSIAKHIVQLHKGTISATSTVGKGTVFTIAFSKVKKS